MLDLSDVPVVDNHCHSVEHRPSTEQGDETLDVPTWRELFSESPDPQMRTGDVADTVFYRRLVGEMARFHGVPADEAAVLEARGRCTTAELTGTLFRDAGIGGVVVDTGFPDPRRAMDGSALVAATGCGYAALLRLELLFQDLVAEHGTLDDVVGALRDRLSDLRAKGFVGLKSIAGYRTGLAIERWPDDEVQGAFAAARREVDRTGAVRLGHKPLLDTLLHVAFEAAAEQNLPVQFHVGYGDPDADLRNANPLLLRGVLEQRAYRGMPVVLLHGCWPYFREGAFLAAVYGNAHLDLSYAIPFLSRPEMLSMTRAALGAAPISKLMYSSDGARVPELHWLGARDGRRVLGRALDELVDDGDLTAAEAAAAGRRILAENATALYGITSRSEA